jgi:hypothetical protein
VSTEVELAWAAGFFEGEGSVTITKRDDTLHVRAAQVDREPLVRLQNMFGGHIRDKCIKATRNNKPCLEWNICTLAVLRFFEAIEPYVVRPRVKERIRVAREFYAIKTDRRLDKEDRRRQMDTLFAALKELNRSGRWLTPEFVGGSATL